MGQFTHTGPASVERALRGIDFPEKKEDLIKPANSKSNNDSDNFMQEINGLPEKECSGAD